MRKLKLTTPRYTFAGEITFIQLLDSKFEPGNRVSVKAQALDIYGDKIGAEQDFSGQVTDPSSLHASVNALIEVHFGHTTEVV